ncbi:MAG: putative ArsR family transcriptional regulator [Halobacteriales archaeon]|jgi:predicted ArsR family transcriptional regulator
MSTARSEGEPAFDSADALGVLGRKYSIDILSAAESARSAQELSEQVDVPIATCYRRIEELVDAGLLKSEGRQMSRKGRRTTVYRRTVDELSVDFTAEDLDVDATPRSEAKTRLQDQMD